MDIIINNTRFIIDDYLKKITDSEQQELIKDIKECNWNNFNDKDIFYFASGSISAIYDFIVNKYDNNTIILTQCEEK